MKGGNMIKEDTEISMMTGFISNREVEVDQMRGIEEKIKFREITILEKAIMTERMEK